MLGKVDNLVEGMLFCGRTAGRADSIDDGRYDGVYLMYEGVGNLTDATCGMSINGCQAKRSLVV